MNAENRNQDWEHQVWRQRDLGWLDFNQRVLHEARDQRNPLAERLKFLAIFSSNLDEFFMKRMEPILEDEAALRAGNGRGLLAEIHSTVAAARSDQHDIFRAIQGEMREEGIALCSWEEVGMTERIPLTKHFQRNILPILTPLAVDPSHPFPFLSNLSLSIGVLLRDSTGSPLKFARLKIPESVPGWIRVRNQDGPDNQFLASVSLIQSHLHMVFPGKEIVAASLFRITRDAEVELNEEAEDIRALVYDQLRMRRFEPVVRVELSPDHDPKIRELLQAEFVLLDEQIDIVPGLMEYGKLWEITGLGPERWRHSSWHPTEPIELASTNLNLWDAIRQKDLLVHHPYESFEMSVVRFIHEAAEDPRVRAIKMTVYRLGDQTPFVDALMRAAESGKQVAVLVEVRARFDEKRNLHWAEQLERAGAHVIYGMVGLKTHCKVALVVREEDHGLQCYAHIGTGNYHVRTSSLYTDLGLFTSNPSITEDVVGLFHFLTGHSAKDDYRSLLVSPVNMRQSFLDRLNREVEMARQGRVARVILKMNQLEDRQMISSLVEASQQGVRVDLIVRGFCCLKPNVPGYTENIHVRSLVGRFLEHARIFWFSCGNIEPLEGEFFIGSADWMHRNLSGRVEAVVPILLHEHKRRIWDILQLSLNDCRLAWTMLSDGSYRKLEPEQSSTEEGIEGTQSALMRRTHP